MKRLNIFTILTTMILLSTMLILSSGCSQKEATPKISITTEEENGKNNQKEEISYDIIKTPEQAASLYDSREYEKTWEKAAGDYVNYPVPPKETLIKINYENAEENDTYVFPYKVNGELYYVKYSFEKESGYNFGSRVVYKGENFDFEWLGNNPKYLIVSANTDGPIIEALQLLAVGKEWAKSVDAENEKALKKILEQ